jgi:hypothetical protein
LNACLVFDSKAFFQVMTGLFKGKPWKFLSEMHNFVPKEEVKYPADILQIFEDTSKNLKKAKVRKILASYYAFVLSVTSAQHQEH